jgi:hypothetical protein
MPYSMPDDGSNPGPVPPAGICPRPAPAPPGQPHQAGQTSAHVPASTCTCTGRPVMAAACHNPASHNSTSPPCQQHCCAHDPLSHPRTTLPQPHPASPPPHRMAHSPSRSRSASPTGRTGIFEWPSSPRMHSRYTALADAAAAWGEQQRAMRLGRLPHSSAADLYPGAWPFPCQLMPRTCCAAVPGLWPYVPGTAVGRHATGAADGWPCWQQQPGCL